MLSSKLLNDINKKSELLNSLKPLSPENQAKLDKKFRLEFNYNSNHLEGNTLTYGETELLLIFDQTEGTHDFREYQEMQAHDVALKMIQEEAAEDERPLTEQFIRSLNEKLLVKPFWKDAITPEGHPTRKEIIPGAYKKTPNSVRLANGEIFNYSAPGEVQNEIAELVRWFNEKCDTENPVLLASVLHYRFVRIHPFDDGNGRTARLLMNYVLLRKNLPLIIIKSAEKKEYLAALNRADTGNMNAFVEYIGNQLLWSLDLSIKAAKGQDIEEDGDLDKELELLKQEMKAFPDEFDKKKSRDELADVMAKSIVPLYVELNTKLDKIKDLFVDIDSYILLSSRNSLGNLDQIEIRKSFIDELFGKEYLKSPFEEYNIQHISLQVKSTALKKSIVQKDVSCTLDVSLSDYHYTIVNHATESDLIKLPYGRFFSETDINLIVKTVLNEIISEIKSATNLKN